MLGRLDLYGGYNPDMFFLLRLLITALALWIATRTVSGLTFDGPA